jgi:hypothetical protein
LFWPLIHGKAASVLVPIYSLRTAPGIAHILRRVAGANFLQTQVGTSRCTTTKPRCLVNLAVNEHYFLSYTSAAYLYVNIYHAVVRTDVCAASCTVNRIQHNSFVETNKCLLQHRFAVQDPTDLCPFSFCLPCVLLDRQCVIICCRQHPSEILEMINFGQSGLCAYKVTGPPQRCVVPAFRWPCVAQKYPDKTWSRCVSERRDRCAIPYIWDIGALLSVLQVCSLGCHRFLTSPRALLWPSGF